MRATILDDAGDGPPIVYVPGIDGTGRMTMGLEDRLRERFRLVRLRYDTDGPDDYDALAASVLACCDRAGLDDATLLAESFGGAVAVTAALAAPDRVRALALVNTFCRYPHPVRLRIATWLGPLVPGGALTIARGCAFRTMTGRLGTAAERAAFHATDADYFDRGLRRRLRMIVGIDLHPRLGALRCPVHVFCADRDRVLASMRAARAIATDVPHATVRTIRGGGHLVLPIRSLPWVEWLAALEREAATRDAGRT